MRLIAIWMNSVSMLCSIHSRRFKDNSAISGKVMRTVIRNLAYHMKGLPR